MSLELATSTTSSSLYIYALVSDCIRTCQNGGTLDAGTCMCDCESDFSGPNCESECTMCRVDIHYAHQLSPEKTYLHL